MQFLADCYASSTELGNGTTTLLEDVGTGFAKNASI